MVIILAAVLVIAALMNFTRRDVACTAVILWALAGIAAKSPQAGTVTVAIWTTFGMVALTLAGAFILRRPAHKFEPAA